VQGGLSQAFGDGPGGRQVAASAPVEVPTWPARSEVPNAEPTLLFEMEMGNDDNEHMYLARASVVEGAGRTFKDRDMSRVCDAVCSRMGFDG
jgi:hypothetical protein